MSLRLPKLIAYDIKKLAEKYKLKRFCLGCNAINLDNTHLKNMCLELIRAKVNVKWMAYARPEKLSLETLKLMKKSGCFQLTYGLESGSQRMLDYLNKGFTLDEAEKVFKYTTKVGIRVIATLIFNAPTEKKKDILETASFIKKNKNYLSTLIFHTFKFSYGSHFYSMKKKASLQPVRIRNRTTLKKAIEEIQQARVRIITGNYYLKKDFDKIAGSHSDYYLGTLKYELKHACSIFRSILEGLK